MRRTRAERRIDSAAPAPPERAGLTSSPSGPEAARARAYEATMGTAVSRSTHDWKLRR